MGKVLVTIRLMPVGVEVDLKSITDSAITVIKKQSPGEVGVKLVPIAFGLKSIHLTFVIEEAEGGTEPIEKELSKIKGVAGVDVVNLSLV